MLWMIPVRPFGCGLPATFSRASELSVREVRELRRVLPPRHNLHDSSFLREIGSEVLASVAVMESSHWPIQHDELATTLRVRVS